MVRLTRRMATMILDLILANLAIYIALWLRFEGIIPRSYLDTYLVNGWLLSLLAITVFYTLGMYNNIWQYASVYELGLILVSVTAYNLVVVGYFALIPDTLPRSVFILSYILLTCMVGGSRLLLRAYASWRFRRFFGKAKANVLIIGAGQAASMVIKELGEHPELGRPVAALDEDPVKKGLRVHGVPVLGGIEMLQEVVQKYSIDEILVAIPSAPEERIRHILNLCKDTGCELKRLPGIYNVINGKATIDQVRSVNICDLLGRPEITLNMESISEYLSNQVVLVTGAGGSIGSELCRQIATFQPEILVMLDIYENNLYELQLELKDKFPEQKMATLIASIRDVPRINKIFDTYMPHVVFHAAAHKHVPLMEDSPEEAVKNNLIGTINVAEAADRYAAKRFVLISTDKAVNPTNVMGATKRMAEIAIQQIDKRSKTEYTAVRFGNVLGSNGSVIPIFKEQIAKGGPVKITHPDITRYFMTIPEAVQLVLQAGSMAQGGEIFVLDMGEPVKIVDLAKDLIRLSGYRPEIDIRLEYIGLRPGEKMFEELNLDCECSDKTSHDKIFVCKPVDNFNSLLSEINLLRRILHRGLVVDMETVLKRIFMTDTHELRQKAE